jgi:DNA-binding ferritin-like protein
MFNDDLFGKAISTGVVMTKVSQNETIFKLAHKDFSNIPFSELSVLLSWLKATSIIHQTNHWTASGDPYYGDHLLFERIYGQVNSEIDKIAEKAVGLSSAALVDVVKIEKNTYRIVTLINSERPGIPDSNDLVQKSLEFEESLLDVIKLCLSSLQMNGNSTPGVQNLLEQMYDDHEGSIYLLKQRLSKR